MLAILNSLNAHNFPIFQPILMILVSKFMVQRALFDKTYLSLGLLPPLSYFLLSSSCRKRCSIFDKIINLMFFVMFFCN